MDKRRIKVLLADDRLVVRMGLAAIIGLEKDHGELLSALRATAAGTPYVSPVIQRQLMTADIPTDLTPRQLEILQLVAKGYSNPEIARLVHLGRDCVKAHLKTAFSRLGASSRAEAVSIALKTHLLKP